MENQKIKYLVKFVKEEAHAKSLQDGNIFMRPALAFIKLYYDEYFQENKTYDKDSFWDYASKNKGFIGDCREGLIDEYTDIRANISVPIFSLTYIDNSQIVNDEIDKKIIFSEEIISEFKNSNYKYIVLIKFDDFIENINKSKDVNGINNFYGYGKINYHLRDTTEIRDLCFRFYGESLYFKHPLFSYQQEFFLINQKSLLNTII